MLLHIYNPALERIGVLPTCMSLRWSELYRGMGEFTVVVDDTPENAALLARGNFVWRRGSDTAMCIARCAAETESKTLTASGFATVELLARRVVCDKLTIANAEAGMYQMVSQNLRGLPVELDAPKGYPDAFGGEILGGLLSELIRVARCTDLGFKMLFNGGAGGTPAAHVFSVYKGKDRTWGQIANPPVIFSEEMKNLHSLRVVNDDGIFRNVASVETYDKDENRRLLHVGATGAAGYDRREVFVTYRSRLLKGEKLSDARITTELTNAGLAELNKRLRIQTFTADIEPRDYRVKYGLGDLVTCKSERYGLRFDARITRADELYENNKTTVSLTLGDPEYTIFYKERELHNG